jgi:hypothetical protein
MSGVNQERPIDTAELIREHTRAYNVGALPMYTITKNPADYPGKFVCRMHAVVGSRELIGPVVAVEDTLEATRAKLAPLCLHCSPRVPQDEPVIVETWF